MFYSITSMYNRFVYLVLMVIEDTKKLSRMDIRFSNEFHSRLFLDSNFHYNQWTFLSVFSITSRLFLYMAIFCMSSAVDYLPSKLVSSFFFQIVFIPVWISLCIAIIFVFIKIILALVHRCSRRIVTNQHERTTITEAILYALMFIPLGIFAVSLYKFECVFEKIETDFSVRYYWSNVSIKKRIHNLVINYRIASLQFHCIFH